MCVFLVCVLVLFRASVCAFRVSELLVVRLPSVAKLFILLWNFRSEFVFSCRVLNSNFCVESRIRFLEFSKSYFEVEFRIRLFRFVALFDFSNFNFRFEFRIQVPWIFDSNLSSKFSMSCSIRFLESRFRVEFVVEIFVSLLYSISRISISIRLLDFRCAFRLLEFRCAIRFLEFRFEIRLLDSSALNFEFVLIYSTSRIWWFQSCRRNCRSRA